MQTNETRNDIIHFVRSSDGSLTEVDRVSTRGAGSGVMSLIYHISRPNDYEGAQRHSDAGSSLAVRYQRRRQFR